MNSIEITTMIGCPLMCTLCPQNLLKKRYKEISDEKYLSLETFKIVLSKLPKSTHIYFSGFAEAWANPECNQMVKMALKQGFKISIYSTLSYFNIKEANELIGMLQLHREQLHDFWVHLPDDDNMPGFKFNEEYNEVLDLFNSSLTLNHMTMNSTSIPHKNIMSNTTVNDWIFQDRAGNLNAEFENIHVVNTKNEFYIECIRNPNFTSNVLLPNGDVVLCCMDYGLKHILGNLKYNSYDSIINSKELYYIKEKNKELKFSNNTLCRTCADTYVRTPWNDEEIAKIYNNDSS